MGSNPHTHGLLFAANFDSYKYPRSTQLPLDFKLAAKITLRGSGRSLSLPSIHHRNLILATDIGHRNAPTTVQTSCTVDFHHMMGTSPTIALENGSSSATLAPV